jgi:hypothetical protein
MDFVGELVFLGLMSTRKQNVNLLTATNQANIIGATFAA